ncbi:MAG: hypothetical protein ACU0BF_11840 [Paracoccaceae bacterium]
MPLRRIAAAANVPIETAGRAPGGEGPVAPRTREAVQRAADAIGHASDRAARMMRTGRAGVGGLPGLGIASSPFTTKIVRALREGIGSSGCGLPIKEGMRDPVCAHRHRRGFRPEALVVAAGPAESGPNPYQRQPDEISVERSVHPAYPVILTMTIVCVIRGGARHLSGRRAERLPGVDRPGRLGARGLARRPPHALVSPGGGGGRGPIDDALEVMGRARTVALSLTRFGSLPGILAGSDLVSCVPRGVARRLTLLGPLGWRDLPFDSPRVTQGMAWHRRFDADPGHAWLRGRLCEAGGGAAPPPPDGALDPRAQS